MIGVVGGKNNWTVIGDVAKPYNFDAFKKDGQYGMEKHLDREIQQVFHFRDEYIQHQTDAEYGNVPRCNLREHMEDDFDRIDGVDRQKQHDEEYCKLSAGEIQFGHQPVVDCGVIRHNNNRQMIITVNQLLRIRVGPLVHLLMR